MNWVILLRHIFRSLVIKIFFFIFSFFKRSHFHTERENTSVAKSLWNDSYCTLAFLNNLLDNCETKSNTFMIHFSSSVQFTKAIKQFGYVFRINSCSCVFYLDFQKMISRIIVSFDINGSSLRKLRCIFDDIEQYLCQPSLISYQFWQSRILPLFIFKICQSLNSLKCEFNFLSLYYRSKSFTNIFKNFIWIERRLNYLKYAVMHKL